MRLEIGTQRNPSSWVGRSEKKRDRESGSGEQRRGSRTETGGEKHRGRKLHQEEIKFGTCHELEKRKAIVTNLEDGLRHTKTWNFIPSRR